MNETIRDLIARRRRQILVHSYIYYEANENIISDGKFDFWMTELVELQEKYLEESKVAPYYEAFAEWRGATGSTLLYKLPEIRARAEWLLRYMKTHKE